MGFKKGNKEGKKFSPDNQPEKNGRKPKLPELDKLLDKVLGEEKGDKTAMEEILTSLYQKAAKGDVRAAEVLLNRAYGMAKQTINATVKTEPISKEDLQKIADKLNGSG